MKKILSVLCILLLCLSAGAQKKTTSSSKAASSSSSQSSGGSRSSRTPALGHHKGQIGINADLGYYYEQMNRTTTGGGQTNTVIIKDPSSARTTASMTTYSNQINRINMTNEILQLRSKQLMQQVVEAIDADINYNLHIKLRDVELYKLAPVKMNILREEGVPESFRLLL